MSVLISDIASIAGVSNATVSNALNNRPGVSEEKRNEILKIANDLGYFKKKADSANRIELLVVSKGMNIVNDSSFFSELIKGVEFASYSNKLELIIRYIDVNNLESVMNVKNLSEHTLGHVILGTELSEEDIKFLEEFKRPFVILDAPFRNSKFTCIVINNRDSAYTATKYLIDAGHNDIGIVASKYRIENFKEREVGYYDALLENNKEFKTEYYFEVEPTLEGSYRNMKQIIESGQNLPTALFIVNDTIAFGISKALNEKGLCEKVSLVGFDDIPVAELMDPPLTTIKVEKGSLGRFAIEQLINKINDIDHVNVKIQVNTTLIERNSVRTIN